MSVIDPKVEIEFTAGVWTDVTADVDLTVGIDIQYGRTSEFSEPSVATCSLQLDNHLGKYTPYSQMLADGVTAHPYYPNVLPRKRVRVTNTAGANTDFLGYVKSWPPTLENGTRAYVPVSASDRDDQLSKFTAQAAHIQAMVYDGAFALWRNTEPSGTASTVDLVAGLPSSMTPGVTSFGGTAPLTNTDGTTGVQVAGGSLAAAPILSLPNAAIPSACATTWTLEFYAGGSDANAIVLLALTNSNANATSGIQLLDCIGSLGTSTLSYLRNGTQIDATFPARSTGENRHYVITGLDNGVTVQLDLYVDGVHVTNLTSATGDGGLPSMGKTLFLNVQRSTGAWALGPVGLYGSVMPTARIARHASIGMGSTSLATGARFLEYCNWAGLAAGDVNAMAGIATIAGHPTSGKSLPAMLAELADTEGGGAASYVAPDGRMRFVDRTFRKPGSPLATFDAQKDLQAEPFAPSVDDASLVTSSTITRGSGSAQTFTDTVAVAAYGLTGDTATTYADTDQDAENLGQSRVRSQSTPRLRLPQFAVDLVTAETPGLLAALASLEIGSRLRLTSLPAAITSTSTLDLIVEGWHKVITKTGYVITFDASPADNPRRAVWDSFVWGCDSMTLTSTVTAAATSISVTTAAGKPTFTLDPTRYPLAIKIGEEEMTITAAPASSVSPQTLTVTRGTSTTKAAPQTAGAAVTLSPAACWTL